jgi:hypothetical protein
LKGKERRGEGMMVVQVFCQVRPRSLSDRIEDAQI